MTGYTELRAALAAGPTDGPWRWEFDAHNLRVHLVGGCPRYDLTIMDFVRWGMSGATVRMRDSSDGNLMYKLHERQDWIEPFPGREHHKHWCANVVHPDMRMIAAADPATIGRLLAERDALREALTEVLAILPVCPQNTGIVGIEARYNAAVVGARAALSKINNGRTS